MRDATRALIQLTVAVALAVSCATTKPCCAQSGGGYTLTWNSIDGGGLTWSSGGGYSLGQTTGQADAGTLVGGGTTLRGGFWALGAAVPGVDVPPDPAPEAAPTAFRLLSAFPNPFHTQTTIGFDLPDERTVSVCVYNPAGQLVRTLLDDTRPAGRHFAIWDGANANRSRVPLGIYFVSVVAGRDRATRKLVLVK